MGWFDAILGRGAPKRSQLEPLFALPGVAVELTDRVGWQPAGRAGVCLKSVEGPQFRDALQELDGVVDLMAREFGGTVQRLDDTYGFRWYVLSDPDLDDLVNGVHAVANTATEQGFDRQLLAAAFRFADVPEGQQPGSLVAQAGAAGSEAPARYLLYNYKRGKYYAFVPEGRENRDTAAELRAQAALERELPWEGDLSRWYPLWDCPV